MAISDDWQVDFVNKTISHVDGDLDFDSVDPTGAPPSAGDYIRGQTSGTVGKLLSDAADTVTGTVTLTNVTGRFQDNEVLEVLDSLGFDTVANGGFKVGDTLLEQGAGTGQIIVDAIEYNAKDGDPAGSGTIYGRHSGDSFVDNDVLDVSGGNTSVAQTTGAETTGAAWGSTTPAAVNEPTTGTISPPAGSDSVIINFDGGTEVIPRFAKIQNTDDASPTKEATVQRVYGTTATGSLRLVDTTGTAWADNDPIYVSKIPYDNLQTGEKFKVGDKVVTKTTQGGAVNATGKIIAIETLTSTTGKLTLQNQTGTINDNDRIEVRTTSDTYVADVNAPLAADLQDKVADVNGSEITEQLDSQGGIYNGDSLNIVRDSNELYTFLQDTFDELGALDDDVPMTAQVSLQQYTLVNGWKIPDPSFRFLESGSIQDEELNNIWTNYQTLGTVEGITANVYAESTPLPQFYIEQDGAVIDEWWYYGHIDVLVKVKTNSDPQRTTTDEGVLINNGTVTIFNRNYGDTYDHFETTTVAGVAPIPLATSNDLDNQTGTHEFDYTLNTGTFQVGEEIVDDSDPTKRGIITTVNTGPDNLEFIQTGSTAFASTDNFTGQTSSATGTAGENQQPLVAGYGSRIIAATIDGTLTHGAVTGTFIAGETVTQTGSGAQGVMMADDGSTMTLGNISGTFDNTNTITGDTSGATATSTSTLTNTTTIQRDIGDGNGNQPYNAVIYLNRDDQANGDTLARMYEWVKFRTRSLETGGEPSYNLLGGKGSESGVQGRLYITQDSSYALVKASPLGTFAGGQFFGAQGIFVQDMANDDIRNYQLIDANGTVRNPPNLQTLTVSGVAAGDRVAVFRTDPGVGSTAIMTDEFAVDTVGGGFNQAADSTIKVKTNKRAVPMKSNVPDSGVVRVLDPTGTGLYLSFQYDSVDRTNGEFSLTQGVGQNTIGDVTSGNDLVANDNAFVVFIEEEAASTSVSNNIIFDDTDTANGGPSFPILTRVRQKGILPFEVTGNFSSTGASVAAIRSFDSIVD